MSKRGLVKTQKIDSGKLDSFLIEIEGYCYGHAILTVTSLDGRTFTVDLRRKGALVKYGYGPGVKELLMARLCQTTGIILRSFLPDKHLETGHPMKELRGYCTFIENSAFDYQKVPMDELKVSCETHCETGEPLEPEKEVIYC
jgi:hypothetical protein